jgi:hypothetical protein
MWDFKTEVKDIVTGYCGKITGRVEYVTGEKQYLVASIDHTGRPIEEWIHEDRLICTKF